MATRFYFNFNGLTKVNRQAAFLCHCGYVLLGESHGAARSGEDRRRRMSDAEYLTARAHQELNAAMHSSDQRVREVHLELADAYAFRLREEKRSQRLKQVAEHAERLPAA